MGNLLYDGHQVEFDDETLMHLMVVTTARLRRNEPFLLSWHTGLPGLETRRAVWVSPSSALSWSFSGPDPLVDRDRVERMIMTAGSSFGLHLDAVGVAAGVAAS